MSVPTRRILDPNGADLAKAEDAAHASGDYGLVLLAVRQDTATALAGTDADYIPLIVDASGRLHIAPLAAGSNLIGKVSEPATVETPFTGTDDLVVATHKIAPDAAFKLTEIELHLSAAPTTGTQNLVITKDDGVGAAYDLVILTIDLVANAITDLVIKPNKVCKATDVITAAWTNTDASTYGLIFKYQLL